MSFVGIDWGTSSFRLWHMTPQGDVLAETSGPFGMSRLSPSDYAPLLERKLAELSVDPATPVIICGMAGARGGWIEAGYVELPARFSDISNRARKVPGIARDVRILPGLCQRGDAPDVMRGEETLLMGAVRVMGAAQDGAFLMPGTHCKSVSVGGDQVFSFATTFTGELFALLQQHSTLAPFLKDERFDAAAFDEAVIEGAVIEGAEGSPGRLLSQLFSIRARALLRDVPHQASRLSGLLIGADVGGAASYPINLIAQGPLAVRYMRAIHLLGGKAKLLSATDCAQRGLTRAATEIWGLDHD